MYIPARIPGRSRFLNVKNIKNKIFKITDLKESLFEWIGSYLRLEDLIFLTISGPYRLAPEAAAAPLCPAPAKSPDGDGGVT